MSGTISNAFDVVLQDDFSQGYKTENWGSAFDGGVYWNGAFTWSNDDVFVRDGTMQVTVTRHGDGSWTTGGFNSFKADIYASPVLDPFPLWNLYLRTGASQNFSKYSNPDFDALLDELAVVTDPVERQEVINRGLDMLDENPPFVLIGFCAHSVIASKDVKGLDLLNRAWSKWDRFETVWLDR